MPQIADRVAAAADTVSLTLSRKLATTIVNCSPHVADRLHYLLERNTDGLLNPTEQAELDALVELTQLKQLIALALGDTGHP